MISAIQEFFRARISTRQHPVDEQRGLQLATAALLFEMLRADREEHPGERRTLEDSLSSVFNLDDDETRELAALADSESANAVSLYQFTGLINQHFTPGQKATVVEMLWQVAYADGHLDRYEEALVRKIADLIHVPHREFIQAKHRVAGTGK
jgi:uncharacterized tellurite resistance protein B-like protein